MQYSWSPRKFVVAITMIALIWVSGCEDPVEPVIVVPVDDPAEAMIAQAVLVEGTMLAALVDLQNVLNFKQSDLVDEDFLSPDVTDVLEEIVAAPNGDVYASGVVDTGGVVVNVRPDGYQAVIGTNWSNRAEISSALAEARLEIGAPLEVNSDLTAIYSRSIVKSHLTQDDEIQGALFALFDLDTLFTRNVEFAGIDTVADREFFALDQNGTVLFSTINEYAGFDFTDTLEFTARQTAVADSMILADLDQGSSTLDLTGSPGGDGERYLGWVHMPLVNNRFWVLAASMPVEEGQ